MDSSIIIVLAIILFILIILNHISKNNETEDETSCSQTTFGCCPNGVDSKINYYGTNCPGYRPGPGYRPIITPNIPPRPIGGCSGTRYGCCPNNTTPKYDPQGSNCLLK